MDGVHVCKVEDVLGWGVGVGSAWGLGVGGVDRSLSLEKRCAGLRSLVGGVECIYYVVYQHQCSCLTYSNTKHRTNSPFAKVEAVK